MSAEPLIIIGAGDHGRGTLEIVRACNARSARWDVLGFLDDAPARRGTSVGGVRVLGGLDWIAEHGRPDARYVLAIADCRSKKAIADRLAPYALVYADVVHPSVELSQGVTLGGGNILGAGVVIAYDTAIDAHVTVNLNATIGHDCRLGRFSTIAPGANVAGRVTIGEGCDLGPNATVGKGRTIGDWSFAGPGAVVIKDVLPQQRVFGNPARVMPSV